MAAHRKQTGCGQRIKTAGFGIRVGEMQQGGNCHCAAHGASGGACPRKTASVARAESLDTRYKTAHSKGLDAPRWLCSGVCSIWPHYTRPLTWNIAGSTPWVKLPERRVKAVQFCNPAAEPSPTRCKPGDYSQNKTSFTHELSQDSIKPVKIGQRIPAGCRGIRISLQTENLWKAQKPRIWGQPARA